MKSIRTLFLITLVAILSQTVAGITGADVIKPFYKLICEVFAVPWIPMSLAVLMLAYAGAKWIWAQDDDQERLVAKDIIVYVLVGLCILISIRSIVKVMFWEICT